VIAAPIAIRSRSGDLLGLALPLLTGESFCFWIDGDEFHWGGEADLMRHEWPAWEKPALDGNLAV
jgi:hypothetical protein